ncbi:cytochrome c oxidase assembly protein [Streptomyces sp900116325]|uniref:cytochrome c oxidase assembly protein n=1 Tax=Streptomyces sp. 900116325 TaxID=3154295 RepID=UPI0033AB1027
MAASQPSFRCSSSRDRATTSTDNPSPSFSRQTSDCHSCPRHPAPPRRREMGPSWYGGRYPRHTAGHGGLDTCTEPGSTPRVACRVSWAPEAQAGFSPSTQWPGAQGRRGLDREPRDTPFPCRLWPGRKSSTLYRHVTATAVNVGWRPTRKLPLSAVLLLAATYLLVTHWAGGRTPMHVWRRWRTVSFLTGCALLGAALLPPMSSFAHGDSRAHMAQHLLIEASP